MINNGPKMFNAGLQWVMMICNDLRSCLIDTHGLLWFCSNGLMMVSNGSY